MNIGKIISVEYNQFVVKLFHSTRVSTVTIEGSIYYFGNIGSFLKTQNAVGDEIICEVIAVTDRSVEIGRHANYDLDSSKELILKPIGTLGKNKKFVMGVGIFPSIYTDVSIVTKNDIDCILTYNVKGKHIDNPDNGVIHRDIEIGTSKNMIDYKVNLNIDSLFNIHTSILGNSGSGKSNTIAHILQEVYRKENHFAIGAKTILFDVNGEYRRAFESLGNENVSVVFYKPNMKGDKGGLKTFFLPYYLMNGDEWLAFLMASERTQKPFWENVLQESYKFYRIFNEDKNEDEEEDKKQAEDYRKKYINYFKWKIRNILRDVLAKAESDTSKMTAAQGVIIKCRDIINEIKSGDNSELVDFLTKANNATTISYGENRGQLSDFLSNLDINEDEAFKINNERLRTGKFFDYKFLRTAIEIVLLEEEARGNSRIREFVSTMLSRLDYFLENSDCKFMRDFGGINGDKEEYLQQFFNICEDDYSNQLIVIDSSEVGGDILELLTSVISRMIYDYRKEKDGDKRTKQPIHLILDEAHRYIRKDAEYILKDNIFERIAREGRKFSLYLFLSSQRPSELSSTVLSQCGNYIIHRIQNDLDMKYIYSVLPYYSEDYSSKIKQSVPGEALIFGNCVPLPLQVQVNRANPDPSSENCKVSEEWYKTKG